MYNYDFDNKFPLWKRTPGRKLKTNEIMVNGRIVRTYADNNAGLWYYHPETGKVVRIP